MADGYINDGMDFYEEPINDFEAKRIKRLIIKKIIRKQRSQKKGFAAILVACCLVLTSVTAFAFTDLHVLDMFRAIFGNEASYLDNLYPIEKSDSDAGLTVTVRGLAGYEKNAFILMDVTRDDGKPFVGDNFNPNLIHIHVDDIQNYGFNFPGASVVDGKISFAFHISSTEGLQGKKASVTMGNIDYRDLKFEKASLDIPSNLIPEQIRDENLVENRSAIAAYKETYKPRSIHEPVFSEYVQDPALLPKKIAVSQGLNLPLLEAKPDLRLDTIGFVDHKLHMRIINETNEDDDGVILYMMNPRTGEIAPMLLWTESYEAGETYYVFDIADAKQLEKYDLMVEYYGEKQTFAGNWNIEFDLNYETTDIDFQPKVDMQGFDDHFIIEEIQVTPIATNIKFVPKDGYELEGDYFLAADIKMKDGSYIHYIGGGAENHNREYLDYECFYNPIDIGDIDTIVIKTWKQQVEDQANRWMYDTIKYITNDSQN